MSESGLSGPLHVLVGDRVVTLPVLNEGDRVVSLPQRGEVIVIPAASAAVARAAVARASQGFRAMQGCTSAQTTRFFEHFARRLSRDDVWGAIASANAADVDAAIARKRSVGRLRTTDAMRSAMIDGLRVWAEIPSRVGEVIERRDGPGFHIERRRAPLGVVAFVFEGRPNVFADAAGVLRNGNTAVFRIGSDALRTAEAINDHALEPALDAAGLPPEALTLVRSRDHATTHALFTERNIRLAVARGSGPTVALMGEIAQLHGIPVSLHGTGGAWMLIEQSARESTVVNAVKHSLDRKVCNTLNTLLVERSAVGSLGPVIARALEACNARVHVCLDGHTIVPHGESIEESALAHEWEWDTQPELNLAVVDNIAHAAALCNRWSPRFVASIISQRANALEEFYTAVDAPFVGDAFTRWVDGQWAWQRPELGLTNWETGRLLGRSGVLSGDDIVSIREVFVDHTAEAGHKR